MESLFHSGMQSSVPVVSNVVADFRIRRDVTMHEPREPVWRRWLGGGTIENKCTCDGRQDMTNLGLYGVTAGAFTGAVLCMDDATACIIYHPVIGPLRNVLYLSARKMPGGLTHQLAAVDCRTKRRYFVGKLELFSDALPVVSQGCT